MDLIDQLQPIVNALQNLSTGDTSAIANLATQLQEINTELTTLQGILDSNESTQLQSIITALQGINTSVGTTNTSIGSNVGTQLQSIITALQGMASNISSTTTNQAVTLKDASGVTQGSSANPVVIKSSNLDANNSQPVSLKDASGNAVGSSTNPVVMKQSTLDAYNSQPVALKDAYGNIIGAGTNHILVGTTQNRFRDDFVQGALDTTAWVLTKASTDTTKITAGTGYSITKDTTASSTTSLLSVKTFSVPFRATIGVTLSQRIANQDFYLEMVSCDTNGNPDEKSIVGWHFSGTSATTASYRAGNNSYIKETSSVTTTTTGGSGYFEIETFTDESRFHTGVIDANSARAVSYRRQFVNCDPNATYKFRIKAVNGSTAPASATTLTIPFVVVDDHVEIAAEITTSRGSQMPSDGLPVNIQNTAPVTISSGTVTTVSSVASCQPVSATINTESTTALAGSATYTGTARDALSPSPWKEFLVMAWADNGGTLYIDASVDNVTWRNSIVSLALATASTGITLTCPIVARYMRARFVNGTTAQTAFLLTSRMRPY